MPLENAKLKILILEDNPDDAELIKLDLKRSGISADYDYVHDLDEFSRILSGPSFPDLILSDYDLVSFNAEDAFEIAQKEHPRMPFIVVSGHIGEEKAIEILRKGITDYVLKSNLAKLPDTVNRAIEELHEIEARERAEAELDKSEKRLRLVIDAAELGIWDWNIDSGQFTYNQKAIEQLEFNTDHHSDIDSVFETLHKDDAVEVSNALKSHFKGETPVFEKEFRVITEDGSIRWIFAKGKVLEKDSSGNPVRALGIFEDITEQHNTAKKLKVREQQLEEAQEIALLGSWEFIPASDTIVCSEMIYKILRVSPSEEISNYSQLLAFLPEQDQELFNNSIQSVIIDKTSIKLEHRILKKDQTIRWVTTRAKPVLNENGGIDRIVGIFHDINDLKLNQINLLKSQEFLKLAQKQAKIGSFEWTVSQNMMSCSDEFFNILEMPVKTWPRFEDFINTIHPDDRTLVQEIFNLALEHKNDFNCEFRHISYDNSVRYLWVQGKTHLSNSGEIIYLSGIIQDITDRKKAGIALYEEQEKERKRLGRELHDGIGQLLIAIKFQLNALDSLSKKDLNAKIGEIDTYINTAIDETRRLASNLSAKILEEFGLKRALRQLCEQIEKIKHLKIQFRYSTDDKLENPYVSSTIFRIVQEAMNNILRHSEAKNINLQVLESARSLIVKIEDDGKGFDPANRSMDRTGLKNMEERANMINGQFRLFSSPGKGTFIEINIPILEAKKPIVETR